MKATALTIRDVSIDSSGQATITFGRLTVAGAERVTEETLDHMTTTPEAVMVIRTLLRLVQPTPVPRPKQEQEV